MTPSPSDPGTPLALAERGSFDGPAVVGCRSRRFRADAFSAIGGTIMRHPRHATRSVPLAVLAALAVASLRADDATPHRRPARDDIARAFRTNCRRCHTVPDAGRTFHRAWLDQVHRTA
jgi:hypothetical protein